MLLNEHMEKVKNSKISPSQLVVEYIKEQITSGMLKAGDRLPSERKLQEMMGVSRFALREGLARLTFLTASSPAGIAPAPCVHLPTAPRCDSAGSTLRKTPGGK